MIPKWATLTESGTDDLGQSKLFETEEAARADIEANIWIVGEEKLYLARIVEVHTAKHTIDIAIVDTDRHGETP